MPPLLFAPAPLPPTLRLGELNASCVGFSTVKRVAGDIADAVVTTAATRKEQ